MEGAAQEPGSGQLNPPGPKLLGAQGVSHCPRLDLTPRGHGRQGQAMAAGGLYALCKDCTHPPDTPFLLPPPLPSTPILTLSFAPILPRTKCPALPGLSPAPQTSWTRAVGLTLQPTFEPPGGRSRRKGCWTPPAERPIQQVEFAYLTHPLALGLPVVQGPPFENHWSRGRARQRSRQLPPRGGKCCWAGEDRGALELRGSFYPTEG